LDTATQPALQNNQLMSKHRVLSLKPHLRLEWRGQDGQDETQKPDHSASLGDSITSSTQIEFSVHTPLCADTVEKVENRTQPKISRKLIYRRLYRCNAL
jgi:hypothetical protein